MHPFNKLLSLFGLKLSKIDKHAKQNGDDEKAFRERYDVYYKLAEGNKRGFRVAKAYRYDDFDLNADIKAFNEMVR